MLFLEHSNLSYLIRTKAEEKSSKYAESRYIYNEVERPNCKPYSSVKEAMSQIYENDPDYFQWLTEVNGYSSASLGSFLKTVNMIDDSDSWEITRSSI